MFLEERPADVPFTSCCGFASRLLNKLLNFLNEINLKADISFRDFPECFGLPSHRYSSLHISWRSVFACLGFHLSSIFTHLQCLHRLPCPHLFNIITFAWYEREYARIMCELMMNTLFHCISLVFSFIKWDSCFFNKPSDSAVGKVRHIKTVYPLHSSSLPLSCANYIHDSDIRLQTHIVTHTLINWTTLHNPVWYLMKAPLAK